jgi:hypothetical protein
MKQSRIKELETTEGLSLTEQELNEGWHFCHEMDEGLMQVELECIFCKYDRTKYKDYKKSKYVNFFLKASTSRRAK